MFAIHFVAPASPALGILCVFLLGVAFLTCVLRAIVWGIEALLRRQDERHEERARVLRQEWAASHSHLGWR